MQAFSELNPMPGRFASVPTPRDAPEVHGFQVERLLGAGSQAVVWLVRRNAGNTFSAGSRRRVSGTPTDTGVVHDPPFWPVKVPAVADEVPEVCALKVLREVSDEALDIQVLSEELHTMSELFHDHVVKVYGSVQTTQGLGLLLEAFTAGSLGKLLSSAGSLPVGQCVTVLTPIAEALGHIHSSGAAHGDVSPGNIFLAPDGRPALGDLGEAQLLGSPRGLRGTQGFMAPERHRAAAQVRVSEITKRSRQHDAVSSQEPAPAGDVYSLAAVTWFSLTGELPAAARHRPPLRLHCPEAPDALAELLEEGLHPDPERRPTAAEFAYGLFGSSAPEPLDLAPHVADEVVPELPTQLPVEKRKGLLLGQPPQRVLALWGCAALLLGGLGWWSIAPSSMGPTGHKETTASSLIGVSEISESGGTEETYDPPRGPGGEPGAERDGHLKILESTDPYEALEGISALRTEALQSAEPELVDLYTMPASPAETSDLGLVGRLEENGMVFRGPRMEITPVETSASPESPFENTVQLDVEVSTEGWRLVSQPFLQSREYDGGAEPEAVFSESAPLPSHQTVSLTLQRTEGRWLLSHVSEPAPGL